jgi:hypothetical protein
MDAKERKFFSERLIKLDDQQIQWILDHDYPVDEKEMAKAEQDRRLRGE